jgi:putative hydrolase of the HAD superfamily
MQKYNSIPNIIFDFGGVILNIDTDQAVKSFKEIGLTDSTLVKKEYQKNGLFDRLEKGMISADQFRTGIRTYINTPVSDEQIDAAWNSMLLDLPYERLELLGKLRENHRLYLLSNTNIIHWKAYMGMIQEVHGLCFSDFFVKDYYSHNMGLRKPDPKIYTSLLEKEGLLASETLFIDDMKANIVAAQALGLKTHYLDLEKGETILDLF